jgi:phage terminase large subunit
MIQTGIELPYNWTPRAYQIPVWNYFHSGGSMDRKRAACVWPRRHGKDLLGLNLVATAIFQRVGTYWHLFPEYKQGRAIIWDGMTDDGRPFLDYFPKETISRRYENEMKIHFFHPEDSSKEGSVYRVVGSDNKDSLVGTNPVGVILSEYALQDPAAWDYIRPILRQNKGWALFISTVRGHNHWHKLFNRVKSNPRWFSELLTCRETKRDDGTPVVSEQDIQEERDDLMPEETIQQEFYSNWDAPLVGAYYSNQMDQAHKDGRIRLVPYDKNLPVITSWDIGTDDANAIVFSQELGLEKRIIDYYENSGEGVGHYVGILKEKGYKYTQHNLPWDIEVREYTSGKARIESLRKSLKDFEISGRVHVVQQHEVPDSIEQGRRLLPYCYFDETKCDRLIQALKAYRKKWNQESKSFSTHPVRDWSTHAVSAFQHLAWSSSVKRKLKEPKKQTQAVDDYQYV